MKEAGGSSLFYFSNHIQFQRSIPHAGVETFHTAHTFGVIEIVRYVFNTHRTFDITASTVIAVVVVTDDTHRRDFVGNGKCRSKWA